MSEPVNIKLDTGISAPQTDQPSASESVAIDTTYRYDALRDADVNGLSSNGRPTLVTLFGISECGKTTFVGSLFAILCRHPQILQSTFIDSDTLTGFQRRVHTRYLSEKGISEPPRTQRRAGNILNVVLGDDQGENQRMVVFSDLAGEIYKDAASKDDIAQQQTAVKYADKLVIFVDTEKLLPAKNNAYKASFQSLLTRFKDNDMLPKTAEFYLVFNKVDLVDTEEKKACWRQRKQSILDIVSPIVTVPSENVYEICSKGIQYDNEDANLVALFNHLIAEKTITPLLPDYNWIHNIVKEK